MRRQFEYLFVDINEAQEDLHKLLDHLGSQGWELIQVIQDIKYAWRQRHLFKREKIRLLSEEKS